MLPASARDAGSKVRAWVSDREGWLERVSAESGLERDSAESGLTFPLQLNASPYYMLITSPHCPCRCPCWRPCRCYAEVQLVWGVVLQPHLLRQRLEGKSSFLLVPFPCVLQRLSSVKVADTNLSKHPALAPPTHCFCLLCRAAAV